MSRIILLFSAIIFGVTTASAAQTLKPVDLAVGYRFVAAEVTSARSSAPESSTLPLGFDIALTARLLSAASLVAQFGRNSSSDVVLPTGGITGLHDPTATGTMHATVSDFIFGSASTVTTTTGHFHVGVAAVFGGR